MKIKIALKQAVISFKHRALECTNSLYQDENEESDESEEDDSEEKPEEDNPEEKVSSEEKAE